MWSLAWQHLSGSRSTSPLSDHACMSLLSPTAASFDHRDCNSETPILKLLHEHEQHLNKMHSELNRVSHPASVQQSACCFCRKVFCIGLICCWDLDSLHHGVHSSVLWITLNAFIQSYKSHSGSLKVCDRDVMHWGGYLFRSILQCWWRCSSIALLQARARDMTELSSASLPLLFCFHWYPLSDNCLKQRCLECLVDGFALHFE